MSPARKKVFNHANLPLIGFLCVVSLSSYTNAAVDISTTAYFRHRAEAWVGGEQVFTGAAMVEVARFSDDTYVIALQPDTGFAQTSLVGNTEMAMVLKVPPGRPPILLHHSGTSTPSDLNYQRSIASLFTYNHLDVPLSYSSKEGIHGLCEVTQQHMAATTLTTWHLDSCSKPFKESVRAFHHLPFLHLALDTSESSFTCEHEWHPQTKNLESGSCHENFRIAPRFSTADKVLNVSLVSSLEKVRAAPFLSPRIYNYLRSATEPTSLAWEETKPEPADATTLGGLMDEYCVGKQEMGPAFLERMGRLLQAVSSNPENLPLVSPSCNAPAMRMLALTAAMVAGPRALSVFYHILQELESEPWSESLLDAGPLNVMALQSLATANPHLPADFFLRPETRNIYTQLVEKLVKVQPPPVAAVAALLESLSSSAPHLLPELLAVSAPILSPAKACLEGHPQQAITTLKALAGLSVRPVDHISSLRSCFATEDVAVQVAAMESLSHVKCEVQGVTELLRLGLESSSDPEIRIAAYQSLLHCLPGDPSLLESFIKVLTAKDETFSNQVASYIWSHLRTVRDSEDPSLAFLQEAIITSKTLADLTDPVAYDPRSHSRHTHRTWHLDIHTAFTLRADLVWGRTSPAPRSLSLQLLLHRDETTHDVAQIQLRLRGLHKLLLKIPGVESLLDLLFKNGEELMKAAATLAASSATNDFTQQMVQNFLQQLLSRIPSEYLDSKAEVQLSLRFLGQLLFHDLVVDSSVHQNNQLQEFLQNNILSKTVFLMPLVHNAITLPSSAGVPIDVTVNGVGGMFLLASHQYEEPARLFDIRASGGLSLTTQVTVASKRGLLSSLIGALDLPLTFIYEGKGSGGIRLRARLPLEPHHTLMLWEMRSRRIGTEGIFRLPLITQTSCLLEEDRVQICLQRGEGVDQHWLAPFTTSVHLTSPVGAGTITFDVDHQRAGHVDTTRFIFVEDLRDLESGRSPRTIDGSVVLEFGDVPAATFSLKTPGNSYYLRGYMGIKDGISHATEIEFVANQERWGAKLQVSTPQLAGQRVWGPALFITTPYGGKREALRAYLSLKESAHNTTADFSMRTDGLLAETLLPLKVAGKVTVTLTDKETVSSVRLDNLQFISPELFDIILGGVLDIDGNDKLGNLKISSQPDAFVNLEVSLGRDEENSPETASLPISSPTSWTRGSFKFEISHPKLSRPFGAAASLVLNSTMTEVEVTVSLGSDNGSFYFSLGNFGPGFTTIISVTYSPLEIVWRGRVEWLWEEGHSKSAFSVSWSPHPHHSFTIAHEFWQQVDPFLKKLNFMVDTLGERIELRETISEGLSGGIKHLAEINIKHGPKISLETVLVSRNDEEVISYGISNELKLDSWEDALRIMGMANCMGETSCGLVMNIAMGTVEWADLEIKYTEINENIINIDNMVFIKDLLHVNMTVDVDSGKGFAQAQVTGSVFPVSSHFEGEIRFNISKVDIIVVEVVARPMTGEEQPHMIYNGTVSIVQESRSLHTRQELWLLQDGIFQQHGMLLQGRLGPELLNEQHFIKMIITLPDDIYYSSSLYLDSEVKEVNCSASVSLAVDGGPDNKYLITGNFDLKHLNENDGSTFVEAAQPVDQDISPEHQEDHTKDEPPVVSLSSLLRLNTPQTGDIKVTTKGTYIENDGKEILDLDVRLVTTTFPELGRLHMAYVVVPDVSYSVHGKVSSGRHSFSIVSYGITSPDSMKSSSSVKIKSPTSSWQEAEVILEMDLIGTFPELFQSSIEVKGTIQFFRTGNFRVSVQRTANLIGFGIVFTSPWNTIPGGNTYIEWNNGDVQGHVMWGSMKAVAKFELNKNSEGFKVTFNLDHPGADIFDIDLNLKISLVQPQDNSFLPFRFTMSGRLSLNGRHHWILNIEAHSEQYNYEVSLAFIRPSGSASVKLLFNNPEKHLYQATGNILINGVTAYCAASLRLMTDVTELDVDVRSSLMAEEYHLRFWRRENRHNEETLEYDFGGAVRQAGDAPDWVVSYRTILQTQKGYGGKSLVIRGRDELEIQRKGKPAERSSFWQVHAEKSIEMITIELTFPDLLPNHRLTAKLKNQLDIIFDIEFYTPSSKHKFEGRIDVGGRGPFQHMEGGSLHYTLEKGNERNHLTKVQVEGLWKDPTHIFFKFLFQQFHQPSIVNGEYSYNSVPPIVPVSTFEAEVIAKLESNRHIYELIWRIDDYDHSASFELENELRGTNGKILYQRFPKGVFNQEMRYEVNFNMRYFPSEVTASVTLEQSSIGRPRAITFSHSMSEGYTELVLDLFVEESDQIIVAITEEQEEFKLQIGQFGNTFLHVSYRVEKNKGTSIENHIIQLESSGRRIEALLGETGVDGVSCTVLSVVLRSPNISPTHHVATLCPQPSRQLILQVMGSEPGEGPYMRIGEMLGPGTVTLQLGTGRLQPLDTPPGLTVTANQKDDVLEVLINWDAAYLVQLQEELIARSSSVTSDLMNLEDSSFLLVTGTLGLHQLLEDTQMLLQEAQTKASNMLSNVIFWLRELPMPQVDKVLGLSGSRITWIWTTLTDMLRTVYRGPFLLLERVTGAYENFKAILDNWKNIAIGHLDPVMKDLEMKLSPIFYRMWAIFSFLHYNDDHSLYSLTWRAGRQVRHQIGRHVGFYGFLTNDFVTRIEREVLTALTWENLRSIGKNFIKQLGRFTTFSVEMLHDSSIQLQLPTPDKLQEDIIAVIHSVDVKSASEMTRIFEHWARQTWSRFRYLTSWHIKGHAYIYGWDNAISWDGQHISSLVRSTCPYLLAYFTNAPTPSAITLQVKEDDHTGSWVRIITLYIGNSVISIDSNLRVLYNGKMIRQTEFMESGLTLHLSKEMATITVPSIDLIIEFNRKLDLCTISIGIFSFARVSGLLGVFDFEANTDAVGPSWELQNMRDAERWGGWQIENDDKCASTIPPVGITPQRPGQSLICQKHFEWQDSPLSFCFDHVSHTVYKEICEIGRPCAAFHTYDLTCKQHFSFVDTNTISSLCDTCVKDETTQAETDLSREVVIVTSLECEDDIEDFLEYLNGEKGSANRVTVRYTGHKESVPDSVNKLTDVIFARGQTIPNALEDALDLDFSYRSLKAVFVFDCKSKECKTMTQPHMEKLRDRMLQEGVHLYITTQEGLSIINEDKLSKKAKRQLLGMDVQTTYTVPHARKRNVSGNKSLRPHVAVPENNVCAELAIQTNGAVFSRNFLKRHKKPYHHRVFHQLMGIRTIKGFDAEYLKCHTCNCQMPCQLCHPPEPFKFTSLGEDDIGKDDDDEVDDDEEEEEDEEVEEKQEKRAKLKKRKGKKLKKKQVS